MACPMQFHFKMSQNQPGSENPNMSKKMPLDSGHETIEQNSCMHFPAYGADDVARVHVSRRLHVVDDVLGKVGLDAARRTPAERNSN